MNRRVRHLKSSSFGAAICLDSRFLALADNDPVATFTDVSNNGQSATASGTARPTFRTGIQGGNPVVRFDGTNNKMNLSTNRFITTAITWTLLVVSKVDATAGSFPAVFTTKTDLTQNWRIIASNNGSYSDFSFGSNSTSLGQLKFTASAYGTWHILAIRYNGSGAWQSLNYSAYVEGSAKTISNAGAFGADSSSPGAVGAEAGGGNKLKGDIGYISLIQTNISDPLLKRLQNSLAFTWKMSCS